MVLEMMPSAWRSITIMVAVRIDRKEEGENESIVRNLKLIAIVHWNHVEESFFGTRVHNEVRVLASRRWREKGAPLIVRFSTC